ncbi:TPA: hypothetical protein DCZ36_03420 [Candidatus Gracilibacteria bacterium]|nr:hypothetical protein [Candidatus Gracilibacteria bacterium]
MTNALQMFPPFIRGAIERKDMNVLLATKQRLQEILLLVNGEYGPSFPHKFILPSSEDSGHTVKKELEVVRKAIGIVMEQTHTLQ